MAKVRKKFNKAKQLTRASDYFLRDVLICYVDRMGGCVFYDKKRQHLIEPNDTIVASAKRPHKWSVFIAAFGRTIVDEYFKGEQLFLPSRYFHDDLSPVLAEYHDDLIATVPAHHLCGVGWIGSPLGEDIPEKLAGDIFTKLEAWKA